MKTKLLQLILLLLIETSLHAQTWEWTKTEPDGTNGEAAHKVATDTQGNVYVLGDYNDTLFLNGVFITSGYHGSYIARYDSAGQLIWYKLIRGANNSGVVAAMDMIVNSAGIFFTGTIVQPNPPEKYFIGSSSFTTDTTGTYLYGPATEFFLCKLNFNGKLIWNKTSTQAQVSPEVSNLCLATDGQNNIILSGGKVKVTNHNTLSVLNSFYLGSDLVSDPSSYNYSRKLFVIKYNSDGVYSWANFANDNNSSGTGADILPASLISDNNNNIWLYADANNGCYFGTTQFNTSHTNYPVNTLSKISSSGSFIFTNELSTYSLNQNVNYHGDARLLASDNADNIYALVNIYTDDAGIGNIPYLNGNILVTTTASPSLFILKYNNTGSLLWYKNIGNAMVGDDFGSEIRYSNGKLWLCGGLRTKAAFNSMRWFKFDPLSVPDKYFNNLFGLRYFVAKSDTAGKFEWATTFASEGNADGFSIAVSGDNIYTAGFYTGNIFNLGNLNGIVHSNQNFNKFFGKLKDKYIRVGAISATQVIPGCTITVPFTSFGLTFSGTNKFTAELSNASGDFTVPTAMGNITSTGTGSVIATVPNNLPFGSTGYRIRIKSSDTLLTGYPYYAYADTGYIISIACSPAPAGLTVTNITSTSANLNWNVVSCAKGYKVQYRVNGTTGWTTLQVTTNTGSVAVTGLTANTIYQWRVATKCKSGTTTTYSSFTKNKQFTTLAAFAINGSTSDDASSINNSLRIYPNPTKNITRLEFSENKASSYILEVLDLTGKILIKKEGVSSAGKNIMTIDVSRFAQGTYLVSVLDEGGTHTIKLKKE